MKILRIFLIFSLAFLANISFSQEDTLKAEPVLMLIVKQDGGRYTGYILNDDGREILLDSKEVGQLYLPKHLIKTIEPLTESNKNPPSNKSDSNNPIEIQKPLEFERLHSTKYIQTDNAFPLRRDGAFIKFAPVGIEGQFPLTKNWSMGVVSSYIGAPIAVKSKLSFAIRGGSYLSVDVIYGSMLFGGLYGTDATEGGGAGMLAYTHGDRTTNFTVRAGYAVIHQTPQWGGEWDPITEQWIMGSSALRIDNHVVGGLAGMVKVGEKVDCVFDVLVAFGSNRMYGAAAVAARFGPKPQHRFQAGLAIMASNISFLPIPVPALSYTYIFNKRNVEKNF